MSVTVVLKDISKTRKFSRSRDSNKLERKADFAGTEGYERSMNVSDIHTDSHVEMVKFLKFFRGKKEASMRIVDKEFQDVKFDRLQEDMYSKEDVEDILDFLCSGMRSMVSHDVGQLVNMSTLVVGELLEDARVKSVSLEIDMSRVEDEKLIDAMEKMSLDAMPKSKARMDALPSFKKEAKAMRDQTERLESSNKNLNGQLLSLESSAARLSAEKLELMSQIELLKQTMDASGESGSKEAEDGASRVQKLKDDLNSALEENEKRVSETNQFQQMRRMMQTQSTKLQELRTRLAKYEPEDDFKE